MVKDERKEPAQDSQVVFVSQGKAWLLGRGSGLLASLLLGGAFHQKVSTVITWWAEIRDLRWRDCMQGICEH